MPRRTEQLAHALRDLVGAYLARSLEFPAGVLVTVTRASVSGNRRVATIFVSVYPPAEAPQALDALTQHLFEIQGEVNRAIGRRPAPRIRFAADPEPLALDQQARGIP